MEGPHGAPRMSRADPSPLGTSFQRLPRSSAAGLQSKIAACAQQVDPIWFCGGPVHSQVRSSVPEAGIVRLSGVCLCQIYMLPRPKHRALPGAYVGGYSPKAQRDIEGIDP